jgi:hypothetical protein
MTDSIESLYNQALKKAEAYMSQNRGEVSAEFLIRIFLTSLLDSGYCIAPLQPTDGMVEEGDPILNDYYRDIYRNMIVRRPRLQI